MNARTETLRAVATGTMTPADAAARLQITETQLQQWMDVLSLSQQLAKEETHRAHQARQVSTRRALLSVVVALVAGGSVWASRPAWAQVVCSQSLPAPLKTFCPNAPAIATDVNANFQGVADAIIAKTGSFSASRDIVTPGSLTSSGVQVDGGVSATGALVGKSFAPAYSNWSATGLTGGAGIVNDNNAFKALMLTGNNSAGGTLRQIKMYDDVTVSGRLRTQNGLSGAGGLCLTTTNCAWTGGFGCGGSITCPAGQVMVGFQDGTSCSVTDKAYCCNLALVDTCP